MASDLTKTNTTDSFQFPAAHLGHLSDVQQASLDEFKKIVKEQGYYHPAGVDGRKHSSHDDATLLRYLRARKFIPAEALKQFKDTEDWRSKNKLEELYNTMDIEEYEQSRRLYPQWTGRRDKRGIPVYVFEVAPLNSKAINEYQNNMSKSPLAKSSKEPTKMLRLFALYENLTRFVLPLCSALKDRPHTETPITQSNNIVDISGVGLKQFWNLKGHMQDASQLATAHYPETLDRIFIIGAPSFFPTVWSWIKRWFDPITVSKIFILSPADAKSTLEKYIDPENIPKKYGGQLDFNWGDMPVLEPAIAEALSWKTDGPLLRGQRTIPTGPIKWRNPGSPSTLGVTNNPHADVTGLNMVATGSEAGKPRDIVLASIKTSFDDMHGISRQNTTVNWGLERVHSTTGTATQPKEEGDPNFGAELASTEGTPAQSGTSTPAMMATTTSTSGTAPVANTTTDTPAKPLDDGSNDLSPSDSQPRLGTSEEKQKMQDDTHASSQTTKSNTPHTIHYGAGDKAQTTEPTTIGQAPKDVSANLPQPEEPAAPGILGQAQNAAGAAVGVVSGAVGSIAGALPFVGGKKAEPAVQEKKEEKVEDERVDKVKDANVEEFVRAQYPSGTAKTG